MLSGSLRLRWSPNGLTSISEQVTRSATRPACQASSSDRDGTWNATWSSPIRAGSKLWSVVPGSVAQAIIQNWLLSSSVGEQVQDSEADQEPVRRRSGLHAERRTECIVLRTRKSDDPVQERLAELMETGVSEFHLGLDPCSPGDPARAAACHERLQQRGLADAGLTADDQNLAPARPRGVDQSVQYGDLPLPAAQFTIRHAPRAVTRAPPSIGASHEVRLAPRAEPAQR